MNSITPKQRGGARPGAGRKAGVATKKTREIADAAIKGGITPLEFMLERMRDESAAMPDRQAMAVSAAPYIHPRLSTIEAKVEADVVARVQRIEIIGVKP